MLQEDEYLLRSCKITENRKSRPFISKWAEDCPFCKENEGQIEKIYLETYLPQGQAHIKVIQNKYPFYQPLEGDYGFHDVVIDTLSHHEQPKDFLKEHWTLLLKTLQERFKEFQQDSKIKFVQIFKNNGSQAGASIAHSHWQIMALPSVPLKISMEQKALEAYYNKHGECYLCHQLATKAYSLISENKHWQLVAPSVSQYAHETWLILKAHKSHYGELNLEEIESGGVLLKALLEAYDQLIPQGAYNLCFMNSGLRGEPYGHFYIQFIPRLVAMGGFEVATGCYINTISPQSHAKALKKILDSRR